jgi:signal transduction histidine kinase
MKIRFRLALLFTSLFAALLLVFALVIYFSYAENREDEYFKRLRRQATTKANLLLNIRVAPDVLQLIYKNTPNALFQEEVAIYDTGFNLLYHDAVNIDKVKETSSMIDSIVRLKEIQFYLGKLQVVGFLYRYAGKNYVITAAAFDDYGYSKLQNLRNTLIICFLIAVALTLLIGNFFARKALQPVTGLVKKVEEITATNLDLRVDEGNRKDEIAILAITFNEMLNRLEKSFDAQKQFVSGISHELRTPMASIITELELSVAKPRTPEEYRNTIEMALGDAGKLVKLLNSLLDMAKASYDKTEIAFKDVRLDELILDARQQVIKSNPGFHVNIVFEREIENDRFIIVVGNEYLLKVALINLIENGCKFSDNHRCSVAISYYNKNAVIRFSDTGIGIAAEDLPHIFTPFYRGANKKCVYGNGIGLPLTQKIIQLHKGQIAVNSIPGEGATFVVEIPNVLSF